MNTIQFQIVQDRDAMTIHVTCENFKILQSVEISFEEWDVSALACLDEQLEDEDMHEADVETGHGFDLVYEFNLDDPDPGVDPRVIIGEIAILAAASDIETRITRG